MHLGLTFFPTALSMRRGDLAREAEARGLESIWFAEHSHIPESPATPGPPEPGLPAEYHGEHVDFGPLYAWPKPRQKPHPPIHVGGAGLRAIKRAVRYGDGWGPLMGQGDDDPVDLMPAVREQLEAAGRSADAFEVSIYFCPPDPATIERCADAGIDRVLFPLA